MSINSNNINCSNIFTLIKKAHSNVTLLQIPYIQFTKTLLL